MTRALFALSLGFAGMLFAADASRAQGGPCAERAQVLDYLKDRFGEERQSMGLLQDNRVIEVFHSPETGSWTILVTSPNNRSCMIASGQHWEADAPLAHLVGDGA
ncbi:MAG: hypothetical protein AAGE18_04855 [Pseudomonadota bacterium]